MGAVLIEDPKYCGKTTLASQQAKSILFMADPDTKKQNMAMAQTNIISYLINLCISNRQNFHSNGKQRFATYQSSVGRTEAHSQMACRADWQRPHHSEQMVHQRLAAQHRDPRRGTLILGVDVSELLVSTKEEPHYVRVE